ncbi:MULTISPECIES: hypothetical protein [Deinococcus]|uniref:Uncharacterized protein n=1 Tax=Deinococcus rufus TaxID=2136097 RepID=A0ABV7ZFV5_9DEIO|nr:hypothetical protein [Deinococcus sp. AB2017081]WQE93880.1 hypothetical protein U2P90_10715 [Deinococcus sp. AB2017081]
MAFTLNLAGLTDEELHGLLGADRALAVLPEVSRARLGGRPVPGPALPATLHFTPYGAGIPGGTPEHTRQIAAHDAALREAGASGSGETWYMEPGELSVRPYTLGAGTSVLLSWNDRDPGAGAAVQLLTWLRDHASGSAVVLTETRPAGRLPAPSEEVDVHVHSGVGIAALLELHVGHVLRHGRTRRLGADADWSAPWQELYVLNLRAWERRGLLLAAQSS